MNETTGTKALVEPFIIDKASQYQEFLDAPAQQIMKLADSCSEAELSRHFAKNKKAVEFIRDLDDVIFKQHVRPFIDRQLSKAIQIAVDSSIRICFREERSEGGKSVILSPHAELVSPRFHFSRTDDGLLYKLEVYHLDKQIPLQDKQTRIISYSPCWVKFNQLLVQFPAEFDGLKLTPFTTKSAIAISRKTEKEYLQKFVLKNVRTGEVQAEGFDIIDKPVIPVMELSLELDWQGNGVFLIWFSYGPKRIMAGNTHKSFVDMVYQQDHLEFTRIRRNPEWEADQINLLTSRGLKKKNDNTI